MVTLSAAFSQVFLSCCRGQSDHINVHINKGSLRDSVFLSLWKKRKADEMSLRSKHTVFFTKFDKVLKSPAF